MNLNLNSNEENEKNEVAQRVRPAINYLIETAIEYFTYFLVSRLPIKDTNMQRRRRENVLPMPI